MKTAVLSALAAMAMLTIHPAGAEETVIIRVNPDAYPASVTSGAELAADLAVAVPEGWGGDTETVAWMIVENQPGVTCAPGGGRRVCLLVGLSSSADSFEMLAGVPGGATRSSLGRFIETSLVATALAGDCVGDYQPLMAQRMRGDAYAIFTFAERAQLSTGLVEEVSLARALSPAYTRMESATLPAVREAVTMAPSITRRSRGTGASPDPDGWLMHWKQTVGQVKDESGQILHPGQIMVDEDARRVWQLERNGRVRFIDDVESLWGADRNWRRPDKRPSFSADPTLLFRANELAWRFAWSSPEIAAAQSEFLNLVAIAPGARVAALLTGPQPSSVRSARVQAVLADARTALR